jgi:hypothetical protein
MLLLAFAALWAMSDGWPQLLGPHRNGAYGRGRRVAFSVCLAEGGFKVIDGTVRSFPAPGNGLICMRNTKLLAWLTTTK